MAQHIMSQELVGRFDVRQYKNGVEKRNQKLLDDSETIKFSTSFKAAELPAMFDKYAKAYESRDHEPMKQVTFKVGAKCKWYTPDENGNPQLVNRPTNAELDGVEKTYKVRILFAQLDGDPNAKEASGYWADSILYKEKPQNPFEGMRFESSEQVAFALDGGADAPDVY